MQNLKYGDGRDLFPMVWKGFLYILSHPYGIPSFKGVPDNIQQCYNDWNLKMMKLAIFT